MNEEINQKIIPNRHEYLIIEEVKNERHNSVLPLKKENQLVDIYRIKKKNSVTSKNVEKLLILILMMIITVSVCGNIEIKSLEKQLNSINKKDEILLDKKQLKRKLIYKNIYGADINRIFSINDTLKNNISKIECDENLISLEFESKNEEEARKELNKKIFDKSQIDSIKKIKKTVEVKKEGDEKEKKVISFISIRIKIKG
ncbi:hypothetical protein [Peptostreptococcus faecalis]|uniref:hypothetical protein n=1 Tax=Peptostreptococcus faecalis TaxID=2045015 RepID=UPI000C7A47B8|nr:hypothetical protein [Peptostreptococcus faecalis]